MSSCLLGLLTRYDLEVKEDRFLIAKLGGSAFVPICPEQLGGLPTPRAAARLVGGDGQDVLQGKAFVINELGQDLTENFIRGAYECLKIARLTSAREAYFKAKSPSCGLSPHIGVTAALLIQNGIRVKEI